jgi:hypothetical protein
LRLLQRTFRYLFGRMSELGSSNLLRLRPLPLSERRAVGGPVSRNLLAAYFVVALAFWVAATVAAIFAGRDLAAGRPLASAPVLAVHLLALGVLPFAVSGASFHLLPVMLRNDLPSQRALWIALPLLAGGLLIASGLGRDARPLVWVGAAMVTCGLADRWNLRGTSSWSRCMRGSLSWPGTLPSTARRCSFRDW